MVARMAVELYDYQLDLFMRSQKAFMEGKRRVLVVAPCG
jgi:superfamily II DNA or RNA helicase